MRNAEKPIHTLIAGCGYVGVRLAERLTKGGHHVSAIRRNPPAGSWGDVSWIAGDLTRPDSIKLPDHIDVVVLSAGLRRDTGDQYEKLFVQGYGQLIELVKERTDASRIIMVSTTGVFSERDGGWVDELSPVGNDSTSGTYYRQAEAIVRASGIAHVVARLSGIYGPERIRLIREVASGEALQYPPPAHYLNHLHADDAAGALAHLALIKNPDPLYIVSDDEPADRNDILCWLSMSMGMSSPSFIKSDYERPVRRSGNKRCSNRRLRDSGYQFIYPTFREGYVSLMRT